MSKYEMDEIVLTEKDIPGASLDDSANYPLL